MAQPPIGSRVQHVLQPIAWVFKTGEWRLTDRYNFNFGTEGFDELFSVANQFAVMPKGSGVLLVRHTYHNSYFFAYNVGKVSFRCYFGNVKAGVNVGKPWAFEPWAMTNLWYEYASTTTNFDLASLQPMIDAAHDLVCAQHATQEQLEQSTPVIIRREVYYPTATSAPPSPFQLAERLALENPPAQSIASSQELDWIERVMHQTSFAAELETLLEEVTTPLTTATVSGGRITPMQIDLQDTRYLRHDAFAILRALKRGPDLTNMEGMVYDDYDDLGLDLSADVPVRMLALFANSDAGAEMGGRSIVQPSEKHSMHRKPRTVRTSYLYRQIKPGQKTIQVNKLPPTQKIKISVKRK